MKHQLLKYTVSTALLAVFAAPVLAQTDPASWPTKPIKWVVPFPPGGAMDAIARTLGEVTGRKLGQPFVIENKAGAGGNIGSDFVAKQPADGYTLIAGTSGPLGINPSVLPRLPYDAEKDFVGISNVAMVPLLVVAHPSLPYNTMQELAAAARAQPGALNMASAGPATSQHMAAELLMLRANIRFNIVHYRGSGPGIADVIAGNVKLMTDSVASSLPHIREGRVKPIALCSAQRVPQLPEVPTIAETLVPGYSAAGWSALVAPAGTPVEIVRKINADVVAVLREPAIVARFNQMGAIADPQTPEECAAFIRDEIAKWREVARAADVKLEG